MNHAEIVILARYVAALCPAQRIDEYTADAWYDAIGDLGFADAKAAAARVAAARPWTSPADIREQVRAVRSERIAMAPPMDVPAGFDPDDTAAYRRLVVDYWRRAAAGTSEPAAVLVGDPGRVLRAIEGVFPSPG